MFLGICKKEKQFLLDISLMSFFLLLLLRRRFFSFLNVMRFHIHTQGFLKTNFITLLLINATQAYHLSYLFKVTNSKEQTRCLLALRLTFGNGRSQGPKWNVSSSLKQPCETDFCLVSSHCHNNHPSLSQRADFELQRLPVSK